jgi:outer membrane protein assembly factor BamD (BamD/ComL family)
VNQLNLGFSKIYMKKYEELLQAAEQYMKRHPRAENPASWSYIMAPEEIIKLISEAGDREIVLKWDFTGFDKFDVIFK